MVFLEISWDPFSDSSDFSTPHPAFSTPHPNHRAIRLHPRYLPVQSTTTLRKGSSARWLQPTHSSALNRSPADFHSTTAPSPPSTRSASAIDAGEFLAISGPSGSGKSTLLNLIGCIDKPTCGRILIDGVDTSSLGPSQTSTLRREKIGFVFQTFNLIPVFTASENVEYPLLVQGVSANERRRRVAEALENVGLSARAHQRPDLLSGGERQRVAVARAIVHRPSLVLADEPTANLDTRNATQLIDLMRDLNHSLGLTFIFSTHDQRLLEHTPRIVRLTDGRIITDTHSNLLKEPAMSKFLLLAFRNVFRNRRRTLMTLLMVGGGVAGLLLVGGYFAFMTRGLREDTIRDGLGHLQIFTTDHFKRDEVHVLDTGIENWRQVASTVSSAAHVRGVAPRIEFYGMALQRHQVRRYSWAAPSIPRRKRSRVFSPACLRRRPRSRFQLQW